MQPATLVDLPRLRHAGGHAWIGILPAGLSAGDTDEDQHASGARLFENGREIGPAHAQHADIAALGEGRFSHWGGQIYVSASDNSRAGRNRRRYSLLLPPAGADPAARFLLAAAAAVPAPDAASERYRLAERIFRTLVPGQHVAEEARWYFADPDYAAFYERFGEGNYRAYDRRYAVAQFARLAAGLPGDFAECGVYRGATAYLLARALAEAAPERRVHLFNSFAGLSAPGGVDGGHWHPGDMAVGLGEVRSGAGRVFAADRIPPGLDPRRGSPTWPTGASRWSTSMSICTSRPPTRSPFSTSGWSIAASWYATITGSTPVPARAGRSTNSLPTSPRRC